MPLNRISTYAQHQSVLGSVSKAQVRLNDLQRQISSGKKADVFAQLSGQVEFTTSLEGKIKKASQYIESNAIIKSRLKTMDNALDRTVTITNQLQQLIAQARSGSYTEKGIFIQNAQSLLKDLSNQLNANIGGRFLFAGTKTDAQPVDEHIGDNLVQGIADDNYYHGDEVQLSARISDNFEMSYGVRANNEGFQNLILAINRAVDGFSSSNFEIMEEAFARSETALNQIVAVRNEVNNNIVSIDSANEEHEGLRLYWKGVVDESLNTDLVSASTNVAIEQGILQATFSAFAKTSSLKLSDYLR